MTSLRVLHVASFLGNIGDNANHIGFRRKLRENVPVDWEFTQLEIRDFYRGHWRFDSSFAALANRHDLLVIGGGNYFELWVKGSATGTTIDLPESVLREIEVPILFNALGVDPAQGADDENVGHFRTFLDHICGSDKYLVSVRNDGSYRAIQEHIGESYLSHIHRVPDAGHFCEVPAVESLASGRRVIAVNLAGDMLDTRFPASGGGYRSFVVEITKALSSLLDADPDRHIVFVPHMFRDLIVIHDVLDAMNDKLRRERVSVAPCIQGDAGARKVLANYAGAALTLAMRFHANVCPIGMDVPTIGLYSYRQIVEYYRELNRLNWVLDVRGDTFSGKLVEMANEMLDRPTEFHERNRQDLARLEQTTREYHSAIGEWLGIAGALPS